MHLRVAGLVVLLAWSSNLSLQAQTELPGIENVEVQPLLVQANRLMEALDYLGAPLSDQSRKLLDQARQAEDGSARQLVQQAFDPLCLAGITINPESRVKVVPGPAPRELDQNGWRVFLVKVDNQAGVTAPLQAESPQALPIAGSPPADVRDRWLEMNMFQSRPLAEGLSGIQLEYRPLLLYSRDPGKRTAVLAFNVGQGTQDIGFRNDVSLTFDCKPSRKVKLEIKDEHGQPTIAALVIRDELGRVYPSPAKRIAPDFHFHPQVYRADGETVDLPDGDYRIQISRGPEYLEQTARVSVAADDLTVAFALERWVDPAQHGWWSGDHHIHAAGCAHYANPSEGVHAPDMMRHCIGEDLKIGANLTWGPCFDYQKQFFTGKIDEVSEYPYLLRYDVEVSGFGSHQSGHLCLLRLKSQIPPGGDSSKHWPTLGLNTLRWAQKQGAVCGPAHSGWGLDMPSAELPNYQIPPFSGIGANEYIVDVTHHVPGPDGTQVPAVDFISTCDTPYPWELNIWYHTLNCGFRTRISGETDFPCIYGERVGLGRSYVKLDGPLEYDAWCEGISNGANYVSDGHSHLMDFRIGELEVGQGDSEVHLDRPGIVKATVNVAARLAQQPTGVGKRDFRQKPYWHLERARIGETRDVMVELLVNGYPVAEQKITADGSQQLLEFDANIQRSSWVAIRILGSSHTNPIFVLVDNQPIRASRRSAQWCLDGVDQCWKQKQRFIRDSEMNDAKQAYAHARQIYKQIIDESFDDN